MSQTVTDRQRLARLWRDYIWPQKLTLFAAFFFMIVLAAATAAYTWVVKIVIDKAMLLTNDVNAEASVIAYAKIIIPFLIGVPVVSGLRITHNVFCPIQSRSMPLAICKNKCLPAAMRQTLSCFQESPLAI